MNRDYSAGLYGYLPTYQLNANKPIFCNIENTTHDDDFLLNIYCSLYGKQVTTYLGYDINKLHFSDTPIIKKMLSDASLWKTASDLEPLITEFGNRELLQEWNFVSLRLFEELNNVGVHLLKRTKCGFTYIAKPVREYDQTAYLIIISKLDDVPTEMQAVYSNVQFHYVSILDFIQFKLDNPIICNFCK